MPYKPLMPSRLLAAVLLTFALPLTFTPPAAADQYDRQAEKLVRKYPLVDTHIDVPIRLYYRWEDVTSATEHGEFDYPRAAA